MCANSIKTALTAMTLSLFLFKKLQYTWYYDQAIPALT